MTPAEAHSELLELVHRFAGDDRLEEFSVALDHVIAAERKRWYEARQLMLVGPGVHQRYYIIAPPTCCDGILVVHTDTKNP
jgi:hypothetical protein